MVINLHIQPKLAVQNKIIISYFHEKNYYKFVSSSNNKCNATIQAYYEKGGINL